MSLLIDGLIGWLIDRIILEETRQESFYFLYAEWNDWDKWKMPFPLKGNPHNIKSSYANNFKSKAQQDL